MVEESKIRPHMEVRSADGAHYGTVDGLLGQEYRKLERQLPLLSVHSAAWWHWGYPRHNKLSHSVRLRNAIWSYPYRSVDWDRPRRHFRLRPTGHAPDPFLQYLANRRRRQACPLQLHRRSRASSFCRTYAGLSEEQLHLSLAKPHSDVQVAATRRWHRCWQKFQPAFSAGEIPYWPSVDPSGPGSELPGAWLSSSVTRLNAAPAVRP